MSFKGSTVAAKAFTEGKAKRQGDNQSTGEALFYHGNKIAEWRADGLYISNGGFVPNNGATGSKTTKDKLNALPRVNITQTNFKWRLNGAEWDGAWIKVEGVTPPIIDHSKAGEVFVTELKYVRTDGWRGYSEPVYAVAGANDTGGYSDSPCPSDVATEELARIKERLAGEGIKVKEIVCESSNVFCVHRYLVPMLKHVERAREIVSTFIESEDTRLAYLVK